MLRMRWAFALMVCGAHPLAAQRSPAEFSRAVEQHFKRLAPFGASGAVAISRDGKVIHRSGFGYAELDAARPMRSDLGTDIASMTKQVTAVAVMQLVAGGQITLHDSLPRWFPDLPADKSGITVHHLLLHQSGLPQFVVPGNDFVVISRPEMEKAILGASLEFAPGSGDSYSDAGYTLLAMIVERESGLSWEDYVQQRLFVPLGLQSTSAYGTPATRSRRDVAHGYLGDTDRGPPTNYVTSDAWWALKGAGGIVSSADDLLRWELGLPRLLGPAVMDTLLKLRIDDGGVGQSYYGGVVRLASGRIANARTGAQDFGFASGVLRYADEDVVVALVINRQPDGMDISPARDAMLADLDAMLFGTDPIPAPDVVLQRSQAAAERLTGRWVFDDSSRIEVSLLHSTILLRPSGSAAVALAGFGHPIDSIAEVHTRAYRFLSAACAGDTVAVRSHLVNQGATAAYMGYAQRNGCWEGQRAVAAGGTMPQWYYNSTRRESLVTLLSPVTTERGAAFRIEWSPDGRIAALGGAGITLPQLRAARHQDGTWIGYHLGIRAPLRFVLTEDGSRLEFPGYPGLFARRVAGPGGDG